MLLSVFTLSEALSPYLIPFCLSLSVVSLPHLFVTVILTPFAVSLPMLSASRISLCNPLISGAFVLVHLCLILCLFAICSSPSFVHLFVLCLT